MILINFFFWILLLMVLMSVVLFEKMVSFVKLSFFVVLGVVSSVSVFAISGEAMNCVLVFYMFFLYVMFMYMFIMNLWIGCEGLNNFDVVNKDLFLIFMWLLYYYYIMMLIKES